MTHKVGRTIRLSPKLWKIVDTLGELRAVSRNDVVRDLIIEGYPKAVLRATGEDERRNQIFQNAMEHLAEAEALTGGMSCV